MKNIKINQSLLLLIGAIMALGCNSEKLDLAPISAIGDNGFYTNATEVEGGVIAIYDALQQVPLREFALTEMRSDNTKTKSSEGDWAQFESYTVQPTNQTIGSYWAANYNAIFRANRVLENLDVVTTASQSAQFEGEAKFARALSHFNLVNAYGGVPIVEKVIIQTDSDYFDRDGVDAVLGAIEADLVDAVSMLPASMDYGRATSGAAEALLAKVRLTRGDHAGAAGILAKMVGEGAYSLQEEYRDVFFSEMNGEVIFAIPYLDDDANEAQDFSFEMTIGGVVSGLNFITDDFAAAFNPDDTERQAVLFNTTSPAETGKWLTQSSDSRLCGNDWIVLRYADVLLMHAEAIMAGGASTNDMSAIASYNEVRARVGLSTLATDGSEPLTKEMLLDERRFELAFENHRFYDLVRFGVAEEVLGAFAASNGETFEPTDLLLPIPQAEINVSQDLLIQNPGY